MFFDLKFDIIIVMMSVVPYNLF